LKAGPDDGGSHMTQVSNGSQLDLLASTHKKAPSKQYENQEQKILRQQASSESLH
jgi:hypothetical protein